MKSQELMIGDWVLDKMENVRIRVTAVEGDGIREIYGKHYDGDYCAIRLTPEILKNNSDGGFCDFYSPIIGYHGRRSMGWIGKVGVYAEWERLTGIYIELQGLGSTTFKGFIKSVHELQHALRLCGIEKDIVL